MSGLSDVQLVLQESEPSPEQVRTDACGVRQCPPGLSRWGLFWHRLHTRRQLLELTQAELGDIGLSRSDALAEGLKPFWRD